MEHENDVERGRIDKLIDKCKALHKRSQKARDAAVEACEHALALAESPEKKPKRPA